MPGICKYFVRRQNEIKVEFTDMQKALTPGQSVVLYDENEFVLGGGFIKSVF